MKKRVRNEFMVDLTIEENRNRLYEDAQKKVIREEKFVILLGCQHVEVHHHKDSGRFVVKTECVGENFPEETILWFDTVYDALLFACLMTTAPALDIFIREFGNKQLEKFVC